MASLVARGLLHLAETLPDKARSSQPPRGCQGGRHTPARLPTRLCLPPALLAEGEVSAEEEGFENLNTMASTFIVLFLLSLFYSTTVTLFKVK
ncbi:hypothetical protein Celaphus_00017125 [Cervus elaphus hippelaphus]|uniref:Uncharacterized protein n=1 Tax=Cervus elaphus hippelaphus TaxID=46360 RepID=A0A212CMG7_CEREH|nr:hypothetical protein Celaphus_00017125 [Cervus elaphus hippelaphus]